MSNKTKIQDKKKIFISYSSKDKELVEIILQKFSDLPVEIWRAPESITPGMNYAREIPKAIKESVLFVLMLSKNSQESIWVEKEVDTAVSNKVDVIPFQLDEQPMNDIYAFYLNNVQMISYSENKIKAEIELRKQICKYAKLGNEYLENSKVKVLEESDVEYTAEPKISGVRLKSNALRVNQIPLYCEKCGSLELEQVSLGVYVCKDCGNENLDDYKKIRNYLAKVGYASKREIAQETGVDRKRVGILMEEGYYGIMKRDEGKIFCEICGRQIARGTRCSSCSGSSRGSDAKITEEKFHTSRKQ